MSGLKAYNMSDLSRPIKNMTDPVDIASQIIETHNTYHDKVPITEGILGMITWIISLLGHPNDLDISL